MRKPGLYHASWDVADFSRERAYRRIVSYHHGPRWACVVCLSSYAAYLLVALFVHCRSDAEVRPRQYALYTIARLLEANDTQAEYIRSCDLFPKLLDRIKGEGPELYDGGAFSAGAILQQLARENDIPSILDLLYAYHPVPARISAMLMHTEQLQAFTRSRASRRRTNALPSAQ